jgi:hypothetical protein
MLRLADECATKLRKWLLLQQQVAGKNDGPKERDAAGRETNEVTRRRRGQSAKGQAIRVTERIGAGTRSERMPARGPNILLHASTGRSRASIGGEHRRQAGKRAENPYDTDWQN